MFVKIFFKVLCLCSYLKFIAQHMNKYIIYILSATNMNTPLCIHCLDDSSIHTCTETVGVKRMLTLASIQVI